MCKPGRAGLRTAVGPVRPVRPWTRVDKLTTETSAWRRVGLVYRKREKIKEKGCGMAISEAKDKR